MGLKVREDEASERRRYVAIGNSALRLKKADGGASFLVCANYSVWDDKEDRLANELPKSTKQIEIPLSCADLPRIYERLYAAISTATDGIVDDDVPERSEATDADVAPSDAPTTADGEKTAEQDAEAQAAGDPADTEMHANDAAAESAEGAARGETGAQDSAAEPADGGAEGDTNAQDAAAKAADGDAQGETGAQDAATEPTDGGAEGETGAQDSAAKAADGGTEGKTGAQDAATEPTDGDAQGETNVQDSTTKAADGGTEGNTGAQDVATEPTDGGAGGETGAHDSAAKVADGGTEGNTGAQDPATEPADGGTEGDTGAQDVATEPADGGTEGETGAQDVATEPADGGTEGETGAQDSTAKAADGDAQGEKGAQDAATEPADEGTEGNTGTQDSAAKAADGDAQGEKGAQDSATKAVERDAPGETAGRDAAAKAADGNIEGQMDAAKASEATREPPSSETQEVAGVAVVSDGAVSVVIVVPVEGETMEQGAATVESGEANASDAPAQGKTDEPDHAPEVTGVAQEESVAGPEGVAAVAVVHDEVLSVVIAVPVRSVEAEPNESTAEREAAAHAPDERVEGETAGRDAVADGTDGDSAKAADWSVEGETVRNDAAAEEGDVPAEAGTGGQGPSAETAEVAGEVPVEAVADVALVSGERSVVIVVPVPSAEAVSEEARTDGGQASPLSARLHLGDPDEVPPMMHRMQVSVQSFPGPDGEAATQITVAAVPEVREEAGSAGGPAPESGAGPEYAVLSDAEVRVKKRPDSVMYEVATTYGVWATKESWLADEAAAREVPLKVSLPLWDLPRMFECMHAQMKTEHGGPVEER
jgi:hypothetical protein